MLRKYFQDYESEQDEDYKPDKLQEALYKQEHEKRHQKKALSHTLQQYYQQTKDEYYISLQKKVKNDEIDPIAMAEKILNNESLKPSKKVVFAGKEFMLNQETGQLELIEKKNIYQPTERVEAEQNPEEFERRKTHIAYQYLNHVMRAIYNRSRKINSVGKSKLDWKGFVRQQGIEDKLRYNRKGGEIQNIQFIKKANHPSKS